MSRIVRMGRALLCVLLALMLSLSGVAEGLLTGDEVQAVSEPAVEPAVEEPVVEESAVEEPAVEEPVVEEPAAEEPAVEEPVVEEPAAEEPAVEEPVVEEPAAEEPAAEEPAVEEPVAEKPVVEEPVNDEIETVIEVPKTLTEDNVTEGWNDGHYYVNGEMLTSCEYEIDGKLYVFDEFGDLVIDGYRSYDDGRVYVTDSEGVGTLLVGNGWHEANGYTYYIQNDGLVCQEVIEIDGKLYGFGSVGRLYVAESFTCYDDSVDNYYWYRAKADGSLHVNEWYRFDDWNWYYYGENGRAASGIQAMDGVNHYFYHDGLMARSTKFTEDGVNYVVNESGVASVVPSSDGWFAVGEDTYYVLNGEIVVDQFLDIDGKRYYFNYNGAVLKDTSFWTEDPLDGQGHNYRAKADGSLYVNEWYEHDEWNRFYYDEHGWEANGILTVDGAVRYFENGCMFRSCVLKVNGVNYIIDDEGVAHEVAETNGWVTFEGNTYYVEDGEFVKECVHQIGGKLYLFFSDGRMHQSGIVSIYDPADNRSYWYNAKEDGSLCVNEWYEQDSWIRYYYGADGRGLSGIQTVDGVTYYFYMDGRVARSTVENIDGVNYVIDVNGALTAVDDGDGWKYNGSNVYYVLDGEFVRDKVIVVDGAYYAFANDGCMFTNSTFELYDEQSSDWFWYHAGADGKLYVNEWYTEGTQRYYYGEGGKAPVGVATVDGQPRFFEYMGCMATNTTRSVDGVLYVIDGDGVMTAVQEIDGWFQTEDQTYYIENGDFVRSQVRLIDGSYYGFDSDGCMYAGTWFNLYDEENGITYQYRAKTNGKLYAGEWYVESYDRFYYGADGRGVSGLQDVGGVTYYFDWNGRIYSNWRGEIDGVLYVTDDSGAATALVNAGWNKVGENWYYVRNGEIVYHEIVKIGNDYYGFAWDGKMYAGEVFGFWNNETGNSDYYRAKNNGVLYSGAWYQEGDDWYYYTEGGLAAHGLMTIGSTTYYFDWNGYMFTDRAVTLDGVNYIIKSNGIVIDAGTTDGWKSSGSKWYYVKDGVFVSDEKVLINGKYYYFGYDCTMKSDGSIYIWDAVNHVEICYRAKADGSLYRNEWYRMYGEVQYYGDDAQQVKGFCIVDGVPYYFDEWYLCTDMYLTVDGHNYYFNANGVGRDLGNTDGWLESNGEYLYILDGELVCDGVLEINGSYYAFDNYRMVRNREYYGDDGTYRAKADGKLYVNSWVKVGAHWYYYGAEAKALSGLQTIGGVTYYLSDDGKMLTNCAVNWDGMSYLVDKNGVVSRIDSNADGWKAANNYWYYIKNGELVSDEVVLIGDTYYGFDSMGHMYTAGAFSAWFAGDYGVYRVKESGGKLYRNEWYYTGARYYYYGDDAAMYRNGIYTINGTDYHFDNDGVMSANAYLSFDGEAYHAEASGKLTALSNGWQRDAQTGRYCYVRDGVFLKSGFYSIDGDMYFFDFNGKMLSNCLIDTWNDVNGCYGYFLIQEKGKVYTKPGWKQFGGKWYYVSEGGCLYRGVLNLNGTLYMMDPEMRMMGENVLDIDAGIVYALNADGTLKKLTADGLYRISNNPGYSHYCYLSNGKLLKNQWRKIGNYWYYFDDSGEACQNGIYEINGAWYYFGNDAKMASSKFIVHWDDDNTGEYFYYYATQSGVLATGKTTIDGKTYYFDRYGEMLTGIIEVDGVNCVFGPDGVMTGTLSVEGWNKAGSDYYYVKNGEVLKRQTITENGKLYVLEYDGVMACNKIYWCDGSYYLLGADGAALSGWQTSNGNTYYADPVTFRLMDGEDGEVTINGAFYRFNWNAEMIVGDYIQDDMLYKYGADGKKVGGYALNGLTYVNGNVFCYVNGAPYHGWKDGKYYDWDGRMCTNGVYSVEEADHVYECYFDVYGQPVKGQWIDDRFYAKTDGVLACNEWLTIDGVTYYFEGYEKAFGGWYWIDDVNYYFDENGKLYTGAGIASGKSDGWVLTNGKYYYSKNGYYLANTVVQINGSWYGFDANGVMYSDEVVYLDWQNSGGSGFRNMHYFAANGAMATALGWKMLGGEWIYFVKDGEICTEGWQNINGVWYYFDWVLYKGEFIPAIVTGFNSINGKLYYFESSGALNTAKTPSVTNGWYKADGLWYYFRNGKLVRNCICTINGKTYGFDYTGAMLCDSLVWAYDSAADEEFYYVTDSNGCVITTPGWIDVWDSKAYVGVNGRLYCNGLYLIDGIQYAFNGVGLLIED